MELWHAIILGITQGLTEFLPISSSGHLVFVQTFLKVPEALVVSFDVVVHFGTLIAVVLFFWEDLRWLIRGVIKRDSEAVKLFIYIIIGTLPAVFCGVLFRNMFTKLFGDVSATAWQLIINGLILIGTDYLSGQRRIEQLNTKDAFWIGLAQAIAIVPGISRSGSTIAIGLWRKLSRQAAARFSFLLSIPIILGAGVLETQPLLEGGYTSIGPVSFWAGLITAAITGYLVIKLFLQFLGRGTLKFFGFYCLLIGGISLVIFK